MWKGMRLVAIRPESARGLRRSSPDSAFRGLPLAAISTRALVPFASRFQALLTLFKVLFIFPSWHLFAIGLEPVFTGEATPRGPQTISIFRTQNQGTRSSLMKTTSARQKALAKLKRADRNVLDA